MSHFIIIRGPLGIGKSTVAKKLAELLDAEYISVDLILEKHGLDKVDEKEGCIPATNFIKATEFALPEVKRKLKQGKIIVFDGNFYHTEQIKYLIENLAGYEHYAFTLKAPLEVCIERDRKRKKPYGELATRAVYNLVSRFDYGLVIDTNNKTADKVVKEIMLFLSN